MDKAEGFAVVPAWAGGDWLGDLYRAEWMRLFRLARLLAGSDPAAEDIVQEAFTRVHASGRVPENPSAYLRSTVVNLCRNRFRRLDRERGVPAPNDLSVENPDIDETWVAIRSLPARQRAVVVLRFYEDLGEAEIAQLLGWPRGTVKSCLHRALARLRKELPDD